MIARPSRTATGRRWAAAVVALGVLLGVSAATPAAGNVHAQALPTPLQFVSNLDLECYRTNTYVPPTTAVLTRHINPVLATLPAETVVLGAREQLCVPVAKNNVLPPSPALDFIRYVDLSCYRIQGTNINRTLRLRHLNPQLAGLPDRTVTLSVPEQLCLPVVKNGVYPPAEIRRLVSYIDLKCYREGPQTPLNKTLGLRHLNPVLANLPAHQGTVTYNRQLCVPVSKNNQVIPDDILKIVQYIDLEKFDLVTPSLPSPVALRLNHINPDLAHLPTESVTIQSANQIMLPVAKNGLIPPG